MTAIDAAIWRGFAGRWHWGVPSHVNRPRRWRRLSAPFRTFPHQRSGKQIPANTRAGGPSNTLSLLSLSVEVLLKKRRRINRGPIYRLDSDLLLKGYAPGAKVRKPRRTAEIPGHGLLRPSEPLGGRVKSPRKAEIRRLLTLGTRSAACDSTRLRRGRPTDSPRDGDAGAGHATKPGAAHRHGTRHRMTIDFDGPYLRTSRRTSSSRRQRVSSTRAPTTPK